MFITFEGGEGSGKTTIIRKLQKILTKKGLDVVVSREPGGSLVAEQIRKVILEPKNTEMTAETEALLLAAARTQHLSEVLMPNLVENKIVICDRYLDSSLAYQGYARGLGFDFILKANDYALKWLPDLTFYLDLDPKIGLARITNRSFLNRLDLEKIDFHENVRKGYLEVVKMYPNRVILIDANKSVEAIVQDIMKYIEEVLWSEHLVFLNKL